MQRQEIIAAIYTNPKIVQTISKKEPHDLQDDLKQELALILCQLPEERLVKMHESNYLVFYCIRAIQNMAESSKSSFFYKYRKRQQATIEFENWHSPADNPEKAPEIDLHKHISTLPENEQHCINFYLQEGNISRVKKAMGVSLQQVKTGTARAMGKIKATSNGVNLNNIIKCKAEFEIYMANGTSTDDIVDAMEEFQQYLKTKLQNQTISDKFGTFIHKTKEVRIL